MIEIQTTGLTLRDVLVTAALIAGMIITVWWVIAGWFKDENEKVRNARLTVQAALIEDQAAELEWLQIQTAQQSAEIDDLKCKMLAALLS